MPIWLKDVIATGVKENDEIILENELRSLGIDCKRTNEFNDREELEALAIAIKEVYFQDYKTAYADKDEHDCNYYAGSCSIYAKICIAYNKPKRLQGSRS